MAKAAHTKRSLFRFILCDMKGIDRWAVFQKAKLPSLLSHLLSNRWMRRISAPAVTSWCLYHSAGVNWLLMSWSVCLYDIDGFQKGVFFFVSPNAPSNRRVLGVGRYTWKGLYSSSGSMACLRFSPNLSRPTCLRFKSKFVSFQSAVCAVILSFGLGNTGVSPIGTHIAGRQIEILSSNVRALISMAEILLPPTDGDSMETPPVFDTDEKIPL